MLPISQGRFGVGIPDDSYRLTCSPEMLACYLDITLNCTKLSTLWSSWDTGAVPAMLPICVADGFKLPSKFMQLARGRGALEGPLFLFGYQTLSRALDAGTHGAINTCAARGLLL